ncbi:MAG: uroporphyrinogen decarboxylase family protein [Armatimonadota bacterium]
MTSRERVLSAIEFSGPDRVPFQHAVFPGAFWRHGQKLADFLNARPDDFGGRDFSVPPEPQIEGDIEEYVDEWGSRWLRRKGYSAGEVKEASIKSWDDLRNYQFPPIADDNTFEQIAQTLQSPDRDWYSAPGGFILFERLQWLRTSEQLFMDLAEEPESLHELADRIVEWNIQHIHKWLRAGADAIFFADDWGAQDRLLISPRQWRSFFKPRYKRMFDVVKEAGRKIFFHTDGWTVDIWDDLIEIGVDVLNPQHALMPRDLLKEKLAGKVCVRSDIDRQYIIPFGTPEQVRQHVRETVELFGRFNGGLILHGEIGPEVPWENIVAMYEAFEEFGRDVTSVNNRLRRG